MGAMGKAEWVRIFNKITDSQNNDEENQYLKSMYPKQKSYVPRFALLIHTFNSFFNDWKDINVVSAQSILHAEKLSNYFVNNAKKVKIDSSETQDLKSAMKKGETTLDKLEAIYKNDPDFNRSKVAELLGVSRQMIYKYLKQLEA
jgi:DNA-binding NtrC family response regulator